MDFARFNRIDEYTWQIEPHGAMRVPAILYADADLIRDMDDKVYEQAVNVTKLPGIVQACYVMPDAHWGYGFPIGGVAAFDAEQGGVVSAGGVGFDISCGVRTMLTGLSIADIVPVRKSAAAWAPAHILWWARKAASEKPFRRPATGPGVRCRVMLRSSSGADAKSSMISRRREF
ncbi:MAG: RtcB family protein [Pseudorhodoplanes sp.]|jgi:tRNA-splicing ligase RtcB|nr:RtcB family protein [Pseudorhodoplanes sp.]